MQSELSPNNLPMPYNIQNSCPYDNREELPGLKYDEKSSSFKRILLNNIQPYDYYKYKILENSLKRVEFSQDVSLNDESDSSSI
jgi:hypothetical protein